jgi:hypothetical protein
VTSPGEIDMAFVRMRRENAKGVIALADSLLISESTRLADRAHSAVLPLISSRRENVDADGLIFLWAARSIPRRSAYARAFARARGRAADPGRQG